MKLLKMILVALCLTGVALAEGVNDHIRQLEPSGVFVDPLEYEMERKIERKVELERAIEEVKKYGERVKEKDNTVQGNNEQLSQEEKKSPSFHLSRGGMHI